MLLECTTVVRRFWNIWGTLSYVLTITLAYHIEGLVFELSRTKDMSSIQFTRPLNRTRELTKNIRVENNRMPYFLTKFDWVRSSNEVELFTKKHEWNKIVQSIQRWNSQGDLKFCFFHYSRTSMLFLMGVYRFSGPIFSNRTWISTRTRLSKSAQNYIWLSFRSRMAAKYR